MKKSPKTLLLALALASFAAVNAQAVSLFDSVVGFSGTQGANGWSYAGVHFSGAADLRTNQIVADYKVATATWNVPYPGTGGVDITATQQNKFGGNAVFSLRYWTADQDYATVSFTSLLEATTNLTAHVYYSTPSSQTQVAYQSVPTYPQEVSLSGTINNVKFGDRLYFALQNIGGSEGTGLQTWTESITATAVPEPSSLGLLGGVFLLGYGRYFLARRGARCESKSYSTK